MAGSTHITESNRNSGFLEIKENKKELFSFISEEIVKHDMHGRMLVSTKLGNVISNRSCDLSGLQPCNHAEADTRILLHLAHAAAKGHMTAYIRTVNSDVAVLTIRLFTTLGLKHLWVGIGTEKKFSEIVIHDIFSNLGSKSQKFSLFHALTGRDTTSQFLGCGKKYACAS